MLDWLIGKKKIKNELPSYSGLRANPSRGIPADLAEKEASEPYRTRREIIEQELCEPVRRPPLDEPLFIALVSVPEGGVVALDLPDKGGRCLPIFTTPIRATDYLQTVLSPDVSAQYLSSTPLELTQLLNDLREAGIETFTIDRCPRCRVFTVFSGDSVKSADDLLVIRAIFKATELARVDLYFEYANGLALTGRFADARDLALETVGHVTMEDPRLHLLLGQLGVAMKDKKLVAEAKDLLEFLKLDEWKRKLDSAIQSGSPNFASPEVTDRFL